MAKQLGNIRFERKVIDDLVFYKMDGQYYVRVKSSLTGKRVKTKPEFRKTMHYAGLLGRASKIGSLIYKALPVDWRQFWMYRAFTGEAMTMLKEGKQEEEVKNVLRKRYVEYWEKKEAAKAEGKKKFSKPGVRYIVLKNNQHYKSGWSVYKPKAILSGINPNLHPELPIFKNPQGLYLLAVNTNPHAYTHPSPFVIIDW